MVFLGSAPLEHCREQLHPSQRAWQRWTWYARGHARSSLDWGYIKHISMMSNVARTWWGREKGSQVVLPVCSWFWSYSDAREVLRREKWQKFRLTAISQNLYLFEEIADEGGLASAVLSHQHHHRPGVKNDSRSQRLKRNIILLAVERERGPFSPLREFETWHQSQGRPGLGSGSRGTDILFQGAAAFAWNHDNLRGRENKLWDPFWNTYLHSWFLTLETYDLVPHTCKYPWALPPPPHRCPHVLPCSHPSTSKRTSWSSPSSSAKHESHYRRRTTTRSYSGSTNITHSFGWHGLNNMRLQSGRRWCRNLTLGRKREIVYSISRFGLAGDSHQGSCLRLGRRLTTGFAGVPRCPGIQCHVAEQNITTHVQSILALKSQNDCDIV